MRIDMLEADGKLTGKGKLGSGDLVEMNGRTDEQRVTGAVANVTSAINVSFSGIATESQVTAEFEGSGVGQRLTGTVVLLR